MPEPAYRRVIVKVSGEALSGPEGFGIHQPTIDRIAKDLIAARGAASIRTCVLLDKQLPRAVNLEPDYYAFLCPNEFVVGYGMDVAHRYRELPFVGRVVRQ